MKKKIFALFLALTLLLSGCVSPEAPEDGSMELWIVTEESTWDRMNGLAKVLIKEFEETNPGVTVKLDLLPVDTQKRSFYLQQLRTQILQGGGPDGYLLPTDNQLVLDEPSVYTYVDVEPLFVDVALAMGNGLFYDISSFYDGDDTLGKEALNTAVMDAGVVDGKRYVLPLRYDIPVVCAEVPALQQAGLEPALLDQDILTIMQTVLQTGDSLLAGGVLQESLSSFSDLVDYEKGNVLLGEQTLIQYMETYADLTALRDVCVVDNLKSDMQDIVDMSKKLNGGRVTVAEPVQLSNYVNQKYGDELQVLNVGQESEQALWTNNTHYPLYIGSMQDALVYAAVTRHSKTDLIMKPVRGIGGEITATVTYYAAVGCGSKHPELTYEFLRKFLSEESQWELNRPVRKHTKAAKGVSANTSNDMQYPGLIEDGWPVRDKGSVKHMWKTCRMQIYKRYLETSRMRQVGRAELEAERVPLFDIQIQKVRFPGTMEDNFAAALQQLNSNTQTTAQTLARKLIWDLRWHVSEG